MRWIDREKCRDGKKGRERKRDMQNFGGEREREIDGWIDRNLVQK